MKKERHAGTRSVRGPCCFVAVVLIPLIIVYANDYYASLRDVRYIDSWCVTGAGILVAGGQLLLVAHQSS